MRKSTPRKWTWKCRVVTRYLQPFRIYWVGITDHGRCSSDRIYTKMCILNLPQYKISYLRKKLLDHFDILMVGSHLPSISYRLLAMNHENFNRFSFVKVRTLTLWRLNMYTFSINSITQTSAVLDMDHIIWSIIPTQYILNDGKTW